MYGLQQLSFLFIFTIYFAFPPTRPMKTAINHLQQGIAVYITVWMLFSCFYIQAQQPITSILTDNITNSQVSYSNVKGAGLRNTSGTLISSWDSTGSYTVNFNAPATANILRLKQFSVASFTSSVITMPTDATVKLRRLSNPDVGDARNYYNFWAQYSSTPIPGALTGTFNFTAPEVLNPEDAFVLNNLITGYDNIFQNTIANPHFGNIERVDFIIFEGLQCTSDTDRLQSGIAVIDRGTGDPFKIAAITALDASNNPSCFGNLVSVTAANFGGNLLGASFNYGILINDVKYYSQSRPSTRSSQNIRGVYISLADLGMAVGQRFYGYALFGSDVTTANPDWTTYPNNTTSGTQLDPVNIMGLYKTPGSVLPLPIRFNASRTNKAARLDFTLYNEFNGDHLMIQHSVDKIQFRDLEKLYVQAAGNYTFTDQAPAAGINYYRLKMVDKSGMSSTSNIHMLRFEDNSGITIFPNPAVEQLNINFPVSWIREPVTAEIFSTTGQLIKRIVFERPDIRQPVIINTLKPGTYLLRLTKSKDLTSSRQSFTVK